MLDLMTSPASKASLASCTGFSGLFFPGAMLIDNLLPIAFVILSSSFPFVGGPGCHGARHGPTKFALRVLE